MDKIKEIGLSFLPARKYSFAITLHNISKEDFNWLEKTLDYLLNELDYQH